MLTSDQLKKPLPGVPKSDGKNNVWYCADCHTYLIVRNWQSKVLCPHCQRPTERR